MSDRNLTLVGYEHPTLGFKLDIPEGWERVDRGVAVSLIVAERTTTGFRANLVVTVDQVPNGVSPLRWAAAAANLLPLHLSCYQLIDWEEVEHGGGIGIRLLSHHALGTRNPVTLEQWLLVGNGLGYTCSASVATSEYPRFTDTFGAMVKAFEPGPRPDVDGLRL